MGVGRLSLGKERDLPKATSEFIVALRFQLGMSQLRANFLLHYITPALLYICVCVFLEAV